MNFTSDIKQAIYGSVVPVRCGDDRGTAFFVSPTTLLTARHILYDYVRSNGNEPVVIDVGKGILCVPSSLAENGDNIDVAMLECKNYYSPYHLQLLSSVFNEETRLTIVGFPSEFGHLTDIISLEVRNRLSVTKQDYDTTVVRTDTLAFSSYRGFSGSPVLNEKGSVIGIVISQQNQGIGYLSVRSLSALLNSKGLSVKKDWQSEDFTPLGRGTSQRQVANSIKFAALRYNKMLHVAHKNFDNKLDRFCKIDEELRLTEELRELEESIFNTLRGIELKTDLIKYTKGDYDSLPVLIGDIRRKVDGRIDNQQDIDLEELYKKIKYLLPEWHASKENRLVIMGNAGMGKTHYVCATAERLSEDMNVYLLFGSMFSAVLDFQEQLTSFMKIGNKSLSDLNEKMNEINENALIIIDAINEGATDAFWSRAIKWIDGNTDSLVRIKFIITFRSNESIVDISKWRSVELTGFEDDKEEAIKKYFLHYGIKDKGGALAKKYKREFNEPLFLSIFSQVFQYYQGREFEELTYSIMFRIYIYFRNDAVSVKVDEDPHRNITRKLLYKVANYSLYYNHCQDIPRSKARLYADQICRNRTWSKSLLHCVLQENLLMETAANGDNIMFGFQKMGEFIMADVFNESKMSEDRKIDKVIEYSKLQPYHRFITALLTDWELTPKLLKRPLSSLKDVVPLLLNSLRNNGKNNLTIIEWLNRSNVTDVNILHDYFYELPLSFFERTHNNLLGFKLADRDDFWTLGINRLYQEYDPKGLDRYANLTLDNEDDCKKYALLLCWLSTSTYPIIRAKTLKFLVKFLENKGSKFIDYIIESFCNCNDPYVLQVITCAVYGYLLRKRDKRLSKHVADLILNAFYLKVDKVSDILVRQWTMLILYYADFLNGTKQYSESVNLPSHHLNPYSLIIDHNAEEDENYFGTSPGCRLMHETLFGSMDFNRYVIGTNNWSHSNVFYKREGDKLKGIPLSDIKLMVANIAKHDLGWSPKLGKHDDGKYSSTEYDNKVERFGKKYLWLALYKVDALLSDYFSMVDASFHISEPTLEVISDKPYPWLTREYSRTDPTVVSEDETKAVNLSFDEFADVRDVQDDDWMKEEYPIPNPRLFNHSKDGVDWVVLSCYDGFDIPSNDEISKNFFLFSNGGLVQKAQRQIFIEWAKKQNFYGRWMPELSNGSIDYRWSEYPWSPTYKRVLPYYEKDVLSYNNAPFKMEFPYEGQLQERWLDLDEEQIDLGDVLMPNHNIMTALDLYAAERGIVRDQQKPNIKVAVNFRQGHLRGIAMRKDYLDKYLNDNDLCLVYYCVGEKCIRRAKDYMPIGCRYELSGSYYYFQNGIEIIQPMRIMNTPSKKK